MKQIQRIISFLLVVVIVLGMFPVSASAVENDANLDTGAVTVEGTNGLGELLTEEIEDRYAKENYSGAYSVTDLNITGNTAVVEYGAMEEAIVVVAIYSEDGLQMITSGKTTVSPDATEATVTISNMPEYFMASAFLVDTYDYSPLCDSYETPMYTREMQELLDSTIHDYDADRVLNLDDDETSNFAVYAEDTIIVEEKSGVNTVISADDEAMTYVIGNADDTFLYLQPGDVVVYAYGEEEYLIAKVSRTDSEGSTVTIYGQAFDVQDVFSHIKIESDASDVVYEYDSSTLSSGIEVMDDASTYSLRRDLDHSKTFGEKYKLFEDDEGNAVSNGTLEFKMEVSVKYYVAESVHHLELRDDAIITLHAEFEGSFSATKTLGTVKVSFAGKAITVEISPKINFNVEAEAEFTGTVEAGLGVYVDSTREVIYNNKAPTASYDLRAEGSIYLGVDLSPHLRILGGVIAESTMKFAVGARIDGELTGGITSGSVGQNEQSDEPAIHTCEVCIALDGFWQLNFQTTVQFLKLKALTFSSDEKQKDIRMGKWYYSADHKEFGLGTCPYLEYRTSIIVQDQQGNPQSGSLVTVDENSVGTTNTNGVLEIYLTEGRHVIVSGTAKRITEINNACLILLVYGEVKDDTGDSAEEGSVPGAFGTVDTSEITPGEKLIYTGGNGFISWKIYTYYVPDEIYGYLVEARKVEFFGSGEFILSEVPGCLCVDPGHHCENNNACYPLVFYRDKMVIKEGFSSVLLDSTWLSGSEIYIETGVTDISILCGPGFGDVNIYLPPTIKNIFGIHRENGTILDYYHGGARIWVDEENENFSSDRYGVLFNKEKTILINFPLTIEGFTYYGPNAYVIPDGVETISTEAFNYSSVSDVTIPSTVKKVERNGLWFFKHSTNPIIRINNLPAWFELSFEDYGDNPFYDSYYNVRLYLNGSEISPYIIPDGTSCIGDFHFNGMQHIENIEIPQSVTFIGEHAFAGSNIKRIVIPDTVISIGVGAFGGCQNLESVSLPKGLTTISDSAFYGCPHLKDIFIPEGVETISKSAFASCGFERITLPNSITVIEENAFDRCYNLSEAILPQSLQRIGYEAFAHCNSLSKINIPQSVTKIDHYAFYECKSLKRVDISDIKSWSSIDFSSSSGSNPVNYGADLYLNGERLTNLEIKATDNYESFDLKGFSFTGCGSIETIKLYADKYYGFINLDGRDIFKGCQNLSRVEFIHAPSNLRGEHFFEDCPNLKEIVFYEDPAHLNWDMATQSFHADWNRWEGLFEGVTANVYYPGDNIYWSTVDTSTWGGNLTLIPYTLEENGDMILPDNMDENRKEEQEFIPHLMPDQKPAGESEGISEPEEKSKEQTPPDEELMISTDPPIKNQQEIPSETMAEDKTEVLPATAAETISQNMSDNIFEIDQEMKSATKKTLREIVLCSVINLLAIPVKADELETAEPADETEQEILTKIDHETITVDPINRPSYNAVFGGEYSIEEAETCTLHTATFHDLVPGAQYVLLDLISISGNDPLTASNLLTIDQGTANSSGTLVFEYVQRQDHSISYIVACGPSNQNLNEAFITFPDMDANGELQAVNPTVDYYGDVLKEGQDYVLLGQVSFIDPGEYTCFIRGIKQYTGLVKCTYTVKGDIPDTEVAYTYGQNVQIKLIEPWGIRANAKISTSAGVVDYDSLYDYGVYFIRKSALDRTGLTQSTITVADILNDTDARKMTKADGVTVSSGYLSAIYDSDIYTYELDDSVFVMFYFVTEEGADPIYVPVRERNLKTLAQQRMNDAASFPNDLERDVYKKMVTLEADVTDYRSDFTALSKPEMQKAPTLAQYPLGAAAANSSYTYGQNAQIKLIEPWGLKANVKVSLNGRVIDYSTVEEYGMVVLADNSRAYTDAAEILQNENAYVFSSKNGDASIAGGYISATYSKDIYTYQLNTDIYVFGYVKDSDGYHYGPVRNRNVHDLMIVRKDDAANFLNVKERTVYADMIDLYNSITAYREDYFKN